MGKKLDNKGLSLIELIVAISMATVVIGAATMFLYNAERSYRTAEYTIDLQMEAQLLMEQMSNWVMESNYIVVGGAAGSNYLVLYSMPRPNVSDSTLDYVEQSGTRRV
ncbi:MAG: prepilin-type N-terminal cleavage/methylation domain-containing protein, partial [Lachnospiraceae bacterium]|nr:prepilin-type N-terminal cleavage/methylation domain-containing protein [Lachnospiraceae bacterium]